MMKEVSPAEVGYRTAFESISSALKGCGYRKRGNVFWRDLGDVRAILELQKSQASSREFVRFTLNVSLIVRALLDPELDEIERMRGHDGHIYWRIGDFASPRVDKWWEIDDKTSAELVANDVRLHVLDVATKKLPNYSTVSEIVGLLDSDERPPMSDKQRKDLLNDLMRLRRV